MRTKAYEAARWRARNKAVECRHQHQREGSYTYNDPYHESPVDLNKYDEVNSTGSTSKSSDTKDKDEYAGAGRCWAPYHDSPIDFDKCDAMSTTATTDISKNTTDVAVVSDAVAVAINRYWADIDPFSFQTNKAKKKQQLKGNKPPKRCLRTACAADFDIFGGNDSEISVFLD